MAEQRHEPQVSIENAEILVSGAGVAGPVLAYWLKRYGFDPTVLSTSGTCRQTATCACRMVAEVLKALRWGRGV